MPDRRRPASVVAQVPIGAATAPTKAACGQASRPMPPAGSRSSAIGSSRSAPSAKHQGNRSSTGRPGGKRRVTRMAMLQARLAPSSSA